MDEVGGLEFRPRFVPSDASEPPSLLTATSADSTDRTAPSGPRCVLAAGLVAHNEERTIAAALDSLLGQALPVGYEWGTLWVIASGCTDRTAEVVDARAAADRRIRLVVEAERRGKAHALREVFARATGDALVLLNADARAEPGAVRELLERAQGLTAPYAVMARPVAPVADRGDALGEMMQLLWRLHHEFHHEVVGRTDGQHLSDELMLVSLPELPAIPDGVINDGSFMAGWLADRGGACAYAEQAHVAIEVPRSFQDHLNQRRRILVGHRQVTELIGRPPATLPQYARRHPLAALRILARATGRGAAGARALALLVAGEVASFGLSVWDRLPPHRDHVRWQPVRTAEVRATRLPAAARSVPCGASGAPPPPTGRGELLDRRVADVLRVAGRFHTGVPIEELTYLLPVEPPLEPAQLSAWLAGRPDLARVEAGCAFAPRAGGGPSPERRQRGRHFERLAREILDTTLRPVIPLVRCVGVTGSAAYGEPEPDDDLDFFVVTRQGALWIFLAYTYLAIRFRYRADPTVDRPDVCFNFVVDERRARAEFATPRGFHLAREALTARPVRGVEYYRRLLGTAPWLGAEIPRLFARHSSSRPLPPAHPVAAPLRLVNAALYLPLATYLQLRGLRGNSRFSPGRRADLAFRTVTRPDRLAFLSERFDRLQNEYVSAADDAWAERPRSAPARSWVAR